MCSITIEINNSRLAYQDQTLAWSAIKNARCPDDTLAVRNYEPPR